MTHFFASHLTFMDLHSINLAIIRSLDFYSINYVVCILCIIFFIAKVFRLGLPTLKRLIQFDPVYLRAILIVIVVDMCITTGLFFYEIFVNRNILNGLIVLLMALVVLLNSGGWLCIGYNMLYSARKNPFIGMKMYLPMMLLLLIVYVSHIHLYYLFSGMISVYVLTYWEWRALIVIFAYFLRSMLIFLRSIFSPMKVLEEKVDTIGHDLKDTFF